MLSIQYSGNSMIANKTMAMAVRSDHCGSVECCDIVVSLLVDSAPGGTQVDDREHQ